MNTLKPLALALAVSALSAMSGCATIVNGTHQDVLIKTVDSKGTQMDGADCAVTNKSGAWSVKTPGVVNVDRAYSPLTVKCQKSGASFADLTVASKASLLPVLGLGFWGMAVDASTGAMWGYPALITVPTQPEPGSFAELSPDKTPVK